MSSNTVRAWRAAILQVLLFLVCLLLLSSCASAEQLCFPDMEYCQNFLGELQEECSLNPLNPLGNQNVDCTKYFSGYYRCDNLGSSFLCREAFTMGDYYYCNLDSVVYCPQGCDIENNKCLGATESPICSVGDQTCAKGAGQLIDTPHFDTSGDLYECVGTVWELKEFCDGACEIYGSTAVGSKARCQIPMYYCIVNGYCSFNSVKYDGCYDTLEDCQANIMYWCRKDGVCILRSGGCNVDEESISGFTSVDDVPLECKDEVRNIFDLILLKLKQLGESLGSLLLIVGVVALLFVVARYFMPFFRFLKLRSYLLLVVVLGILIWLLYTYLSKLTWRGVFL
jgi:hypothetical protein